MIMRLPSVAAVQQMLEVSFSSEGLNAVFREIGIML